MIKFVVVEDDENIQAKIKKILRKISMKNDIDIGISFYNKYCEKLQKEIDSTLYRKVYILDIELKNSISGIEIGSKIREKDWDSEIIFSTSHDNMFETVHREIKEVFDFIEKFQNMEERLEKDIELIYNKKLDDKLLRIKNKPEEITIYMREILYITRDKEERKSIIHTTETNFKVNDSLTELLEKLDHRFVQTHRSCIANKTHMSIRNYPKGYFITDTGERVEYLSKNYRKEIEKDE